MTKETKKPTIKKRLAIKNPLLMVFEDAKRQIICQFSKEGRSQEYYGRLVAHLVRHIATAYKVKEDDVWVWVDKERYSSVSDKTKIQ